MIMRGKGGFLRNYRYLIKDQFEANSVAHDLRVQLEVNRFHDVNISAVENGNEVIVKVPQPNENLEETVETFMADYQSGIIME
jgi:hypothetical protein